MSSKEEILARIRQNTGHRYEMPDLKIDAITYPDRLQTFMEVLKAAGGEAYMLKEEEDVNQVIRQLYPNAVRIASSLKEIECATFNPDELEDPRELNGTDVAVVKGSFGVAENGAVWLPKQTRHKAVFFISEALVILLDKQSLVNNMNEAYGKSIRTTAMITEYSCPDRPKQPISNKHWFWGTWTNSSNGDFAIRKQKRDRFMY